MNKKITFIGASILIIIIAFSLYIFKYNSEEKMLVKAVLAIRDNEVIGDEIKQYINTIVLKEAYICNGNFGIIVAYVETKNKSLSIDDTIYIYDKQILLNTFDEPRECLTKEEHDNSAVLANPHTGEVFEKEDWSKEKYELCLKNRRDYLSLEHDYKEKISVTKTTCNQNKRKLNFIQLYKINSKVKRDFNKIK